MEKEIIFHGPRDNTKKMIEAERVIDMLTKASGSPPTVSQVAYCLGISKSTAYTRLNFIMHKLKTRNS